MPGSSTSSPSTSTSENGNMVDRRNDRILSDDEAATFYDFVSARTISADFIKKKSLIVSNLPDEEPALWQYDVRELWQELFKRDEEFCDWVRAFGGDQVLMCLMEDGFLLDLVEQGFECSSAKYPRLKKYQEWLRRKEDRLWDQWVVAKAQAECESFLTAITKQEHGEQEHIGSKTA